MKYLRKFESKFESSEENNLRFKTDESLLSSNYTNVDIVTKDNVGIIEEFLGKRIIDIKYSDSELMFLISTDDDEIKYVFYHDQNCCEDCWLDDIVGDLSDLLDRPLLKAEERINDGDDINVKPKLRRSLDDSSTWTFYTFATINGYVDIRFCGTSNSERFNIARLYE